MEQLHCCCWYTRGAGKRCMLAAVCTPSCCSSSWRHQSRSQTGCSTDLQAQEDECVSAQAVLSGLKQRLSGQVIADSSTLMRTCSHATCYHSAVSTQSSHLWGSGQRKARTRRPCWRLAVSAGWAQAVGTCPCRRCPPRSSGTGRCRRRHPHRWCRRLPGCNTARAHSQRSGHRRARHAWRCEWGRWAGRHMAGSQGRRSLQAAVGRAGG